MSAIYYGPGSFNWNYSEPSSGEIVVIEFAYLQQTYERYCTMEKEEMISEDKHKKDYASRIQSGEEVRQKIREELLQCIYPYNTDYSSTDDAFVNIVTEGVYKESQ